MVDKNTNIRFVDAFAGIGGFHLGILGAFPRAECVLTIEKDKQCQQVYKNNFANTKIIGDITLVDIENEIPPHDLLVGGFPCQPFSRAGKHSRLNDNVIHEDDRANLFLNLAEILRVHQPKWFLFENVTGLRRAKNPDGSFILDTIVDILHQVGYEVLVGELDSKDFGLAQSRNRLFILGQLVKIGKLDITQMPHGRAGTATVRDILEKEPTGYLLAESVFKNKVILERGVQFLEEKNHPFPAGTSRLEVLRYLAASSPKVGQVSTSSALRLAAIHGDTPSGISRQGDRIYSIDGLAPTLTTITQVVYAIEPEWRTLSDREWARLQGFPDTFIGATKKQLGNAVSVPVITALVKHLLGVT